MKKGVKAPGKVEQRAHKTAREIYLRLSIIIALTSVFSMFVSIIILYVLSAQIGLMVSAIEVGVLITTIAFIIVSTRYSSQSFSEDVTQLSNVFTTSSIALQAHYTSSSEKIIQGLEDSASKQINAMKEHENKNEEVIMKLTKTVSEIGELQVKILQTAVSQHDQLEKMKEATNKLMEEQQKRTSEIIVRQEQVESERRKSEEERKALDYQRDESARKRLIPILKIGLYVNVINTFYHHVCLRLYNDGMTGYNIIAILTDSIGHQQAGAGGTILPQNLISIDFGDVTNYHRREQFKVSVKVADAAGRIYQYDTSFEYQRYTGIIGTTSGWSINPSEWVSPSPNLVHLD